MRIKETTRPPRSYVSHTPTVIERRIYTLLPEPSILKSGKKRLVVSKGLILSTFIVLGLLTSGGAYAYMRPKPPQFPVAVTTQAEFQLFIPSELPEGFIIDQNSFSYDGGALLYTISGPNGRTIIITQQPKPAGMDLKKFNKEKIAKGISLKVPAGEAVIGLLGTNQAASIIGTETWIIISDPAKGNRGVVKKIAGSLKPISQ